MTPREPLLDRFGRALAAGQRRAWLAAGTALALFYVLGAAANLGETDDVYEFAYRAENLPASDVSDPRLMLFHVLTRGLYLAFHALAPETRALWVMRGFSAICAALLLLLVVRVLVNAFRVPPGMAVLAAAALGVSYGFWRYAAEAEVYVAAMLLTLAVFALLAQRAAGARDGLRAGALAGVAVLFYQPDVIPLLMAFPLLLALRRRWPALGAYLALALAVVAAGYLAGFRVHWPEPLTADSARAFLTQRSGEFAVAPLSARTVAVSLVRGAFAFGHDVAAATWLFGFEPAVDLIRAAFPGNVIHEEVYAASRAGWPRFAPLILLPALVVLVLAGLAHAGRAGVRGALANVRDCPLVATTVAWLALQALVIGRLNPAGTEAWIVVLLPVSLLLGALVLSRLAAPRPRRFAIAAVALLLAHNLAGGMALSWDPDLDLDRVRAGWALGNARAGDLVVVAGNPGFAELLRYRTPADVALIRPGHAPRLATAILSGNSQLPVPARHRQHPRRNAAALANRCLAAGGRVILFADFFGEDPLPVAPQEPFHGHERERLAALRARLQIVREHPDVGATYLLTASAAR